MQWSLLGRVLHSGDSRERDTGFYSLLHSDQSLVGFICTGYGRRGVALALEYYSREESAKRESMYRVSSLTKLNLTSSYAPAYVRT